MEQIILAAEDDENDQLFLRRAFQKIRPSVRLQIVGSGACVLEYLQGEGKYADRVNFPTPTGILLDLKMPKMGGLEVLSWLHDHTECAVIPVIVWTSSRHPSDVRMAYQLGANCYMVKPSTLEGIQEWLDLILRFWETCEKPTPPAKC
jgi:CheY-like chemotaxis protein